MRYQSEEEKYILSIKSYLRDLADVAGKNKLILTFCLLFGLVGTIIMVIGLFFAIHWVVGLIVTILAIGFVSYQALFINFKDESRD